METSSSWNRREFVQMAGLSLGAMSFASPGYSHGIQKNGEKGPGFAFVGLELGGIAAFDVKGYRWRQTSCVASNAPVSLVLSGDERYLYAVNAVDNHAGLPSGTVEAYAIDAGNGSLELMNRQTLSLSATHPAHAAITPDGRVLVVSVQGGGAYNVLPIQADGRLGAVKAILKVTGSGPDERQKSAHPQMVTFDRVGRIVSADLGNDRVTVLGFDGTSLNVLAEHSAEAGKGPHQVAFHPNGLMLFVANGLDSSVDCYEYNADQGRIVGILGQFATSRWGTAGGLVMAMDPTGEFLYTAHQQGSEGISIWRIEKSIRALERLQIADEGGPPLHKLLVTSDGNTLLGVSRKGSGIFAWNLTYGRVGHGVPVVNLTAPMCIAVKSL